MNSGSRPDTNGTTKMRPPTRIPANYTRRQAGEGVGCASAMPMDSALTPPNCKQPERPANLDSTRVAAILWKSAGEAFGLAFGVTIMGSIGFGLVSGLWREMMPSPPPVLAGKTLAEAEPASSWKFPHAWLGEHR